MFALLRLVRNLYRRHPWADTHICRWKVSTLDWVWSKIVGCIWSTPTGCAAVRPYDRCVEPSNPHDF